jgi:serine acetyltransferase
MEDYSIIATMSVALPGSVIGRGALVGAMSLVKGTVPPDSIYVGNPGKVVGSTGKIRLKNGELAYPWRRHFHRGYPDEVVARWKREFET